MRILLLICLLLSACSIKHSTENQLTQLTQDTWFLANGQGAYFRLNPTTKQVSAYAGCNRIGGSYQLNNTQLRFSNLVQTKMFCADAMQNEQRLSDALHQSNRFILAENELTLYQDERKLETFYRSNQPAELQNKRWTLKSLNEKVIHSNADVTLNFRPNGKIDGNAGCNNYFGTYQVSTNSLTMGEIGTTRMFCDEQMNLEQDFLQALKKTNRFESFGDHLILFEDTKPLARFVAIWLN